jgi:tripeptidyl-peptidase-1
LVYYIRAFLHNASSGFSNYFSTPDYQTGDVAAYVASLGTTYAGKYNGSGRGFPDVSAQGESFEIAWGAPLPFFLDATIYRRN